MSIHNDPVTKIRHPSGQGTMQVGGLQLQDTLTETQPPVQQPELLPVVSRFRG